MAFIMVRVSGIWYSRPMIKIDIIFAPFGGMVRSPVAAGLILVIICLQRFPRWGILIYGPHERGEFNLSIFV
jgi:hypothetical protein